MSNTLLIWNGSSGKAVINHELVERLTLRSNSSIKMSRDVDLTEEIARATDRGCDTVIAAGGDGTVNAVVNALMGVDASRRPQLAILPFGTANDFAGTLCIPDVKQAMQLLDTTRSVPIDVVKIRAREFERYYANVAAGGNSVRVSEEITEEMKSRWGAFCYLRGALDVLADLKTFRITAACDEETFSGIGTWAVLVANGKTNAGRITVAPEASPIDGLLDVIIIRDGTVLDIVDIVSGALLGSYLECEQVIHRQVKRLTLHSEPAMRFTLDGELIDHEPVQFDVVAGAIRMFVGSEFLLENRKRLSETPEATYGL